MVSCAHPLERDSHKEKYIVTILTAVEWLWQILFTHVWYNANIPFTEIYIHAQHNQLNSSSYYSTFHTWSHYTYDHILGALRFDWLNENDDR
jgi:hypothetical protein